MRLDAARREDVYFAFRLAFSDQPEVRLRVTDDQPRPGYDRGRFLPQASTVRVFLWRDGEEPRLAGESFRFGSLESVEGLGEWALGECWRMGGHPPDLAADLLWTREDVGMLDYFAAQDSIRGW